MTDITGPGFSLRDALNDELDAVGEVIRAAYREYEPNYPPERWTTYSQNVGDVRSRLAGCELIVAVVEGAIAGCVAFYADGSSSRQGEWPRAGRGSSASPCRRPIAASASVAP